MPHDQQAVEQTKRYRRHDEQIHRRDAVGMIADEGVPALGRRPSTPDPILGHAGLTDIDAERRRGCAARPRVDLRRSSRGSAGVFRVAPSAGHHGVSASSASTTGNPRDANQ